MLLSIAYKKYRKTSEFINYFHCFFFTISIPVGPCMVVMFSGKSIESFGSLEKKYSLAPPLPSRP